MAYRHTVPGGKNATHFLLFATPQTLNSDLFQGYLVEGVHGVLHALSDHTHFVWLHSNLTNNNITTYITKKKEKYSETKILQIDQYSNIMNAFYIPLYGALSLSLPRFKSSVIIHKDPHVTSGHMFSFIVLIPWTSLSETIFYFLPWVGHCKVKSARPSSVSPQLQLMNDSNMHHPLQ